MTARRPNRTRFLLLLGALAVVAGIAAYRFWASHIPDLPYEPVAPESKEGFTSVPINPMIELDSMSREDFDKMRRRYVHEHPRLLARLGRDRGRYALSEEVFGKVEGGKPWWGILGISYYGSGEKSIEGPSEESRFIANPYLLVAVLESWANEVPSGAGLPPVAIYPEPTFLGWSPDRAHGWATYDLTEYFRKAGPYGFREPRDGELNLCTYNARDLGLVYIQLDPQRSRGVKILAPSSPFRNPQYLGVGASCGYPGG